MDALTVILDALQPLAGRAVLDVGCGAGDLAKVLDGRGARVTGIDPNAEAVAAARRKVPGATFLQASATALPLADGSAEGAVLLNSLHHVGAPGAALADLARVLRPDAPLVVVEPLTRGSSFEVLLRIEDETAVRDAAQAALAEAVASGLFRLARDVTFDRAERFASVDAFLARVVAVDPARAAAVAAHRAEVEASFERCAEADGGGHVLRQPLRAQVLVPL